MKTKKKDLKENKKAKTKDKNKSEKVSKKEKTKERKFSMTKKCVSLLDAVDAVITEKQDEKKAASVFPLLRKAVKRLGQNPEKIFTKMSKLGTTDSKEAKKSKKDKKQKIEEKKSKIKAKDVKSKAKTSTKETKKPGRRRKELTDMTLAELKAVAKKNKVAMTGTKPDLIKRLKKIY